MSLLATEGDLGRPRNVIRLAEELFGTDTGLPANRICSSHISTARAHLDLGDRDSAQASLVRAWQIAPQRAKTEPTSREVLRVLISLHRRSNPHLVQLAKQAGLTVYVVGRCGPGHRVVTVLLTLSGRLRSPLGAVNSTSPTSAALKTSAASSSRHALSLR